LPLRYLAVGESVYSLHIQYCVGRSTIYKFIPEVCEAIWCTLMRQNIINPISNANVTKLADDFYSRWDLPNCVGAMDGKHIRIKAPRNSGTKFFNYKSYYSVVLFAVCDSNYKFTYVDIGAFGSQHDSGIFTASTLCQQIEAKKIGKLYFLTSFHLILYLHPFRPQSRPIFAEN
jgi:DDE superfamily endonuclease